MTCLSYSPDGERIASGSSDTRIKIWELRNADVRTLAKQKYGILSLAFSPIGDRLASGDAKGNVLIWDVRRFSVEKLLAGHKGEVYSLSFTPTGKHLLTGSRDKTARVWDVEKGQQVSVYAAKNSVTSVLFLHDGKDAAFATGDLHTVSPFTDAPAVPGDIYFWRIGLNN